MFIRRAGASEFVVIYEKEVHSDIAGWSVTKYNHFEADTLITCVIEELRKLENSNHFRIVTPDTDVVILYILPHT